MASYFDSYLESISTLPVELSRSFSLIHELDEKSQVFLSKAEAVMMRQVQEDIGKDEMLTEEAIKELHRDLQTCAALGDERISLAMQAYEQVDKHIVRLDQSLKKVEQELQLHANEDASRGGCAGVGASDDTPAPSPFGAIPSAILQAKCPQFRASPQSAAVGVDDGSLALGRSRKCVARDVVTSKTPLARRHGMPADANEQKYCICNDVSSGTMVACGNVKCPIEWFHMECVDLTMPVKGTWVCPICRETARSSDASEPVEASADKRMLYRSH